MTRLSAAILAAAILSGIGALAPTASSRSGPRISIRLLSAGPRTVKPVYKKKRKQWTHCTVEIKTRVRGVTLTAAVPTKRPLHGEGNVEAFRGRIPKAAYSRRQVSPFWIGETPGTTFTICMAPPFFSLGTHRILVTVGKTTGALYRGVRPVTVMIKVK